MFQLPLVLVFVTPAFVTSTTMAGYSHGLGQNQSSYFSDTPRGILSEAIVSHHEQQFGSSLCSMRPLAHGIFYGVNIVHYNNAKHCCLQKGLTLLTIPKHNGTEEKLGKVRESIITSPFRVNPVGRAFPLFVNVEDEKYKQKCPGVHIRSPANGALDIVAANCSIPQRFLCEYPSNEFFPECEEIAYEHLGTTRNLVYSPTMLPWNEALRCCEERDQELVKIGDEKLEKFLYDTVISRDLTDEKHYMFWTAAHKRLESTSFQWQDNTVVAKEDLLNVNRSSEFCGVAIAKKGQPSLKYGDAACESRRNFICSSERPRKCTKSMPWRRIVVPEMNREYYYPPALRLTWGDASLCCSSLGYRLLTVIAPTVGDQIAFALYSNESLRYSHQGFLNGLWIGARMSQMGSFTFLNVEGSTSFTFGKGYDNYIPGSLEDDDNCLTFIVDTRISFALLGTACTVKRSFMCELPYDFGKELSAKFYDVGNRYYYGKAPLTYREANKSCQSNAMTLFVPQSQKDTKMVARGVLHFHAHVSYANGFWTGPKDRSRYVPINLVPRELTFPRGEPRDLADLYGRVYMGDISQGWCQIGIVKQRTMLKRTRSMCSRELHYVCEVPTDPEPDVCGGLVRDEHFVTEKSMFVSKKAANWFKARKCCREYGNFELVALVDKADYEDIYQISNHQGFLRPHGGFWTSGSNHVVRDRFAWHSGWHSFLKQKKIFYHSYLNPEEKVTDETQCLEGFYHAEEDRIQVSHDDCWKPKHYICKKKLLNTWYPPMCEEVIYKRIGNTSFFFAMDEMPWIRAAECCAQRAAVLAKLEADEQSQELNSEIQRLFQNTHDVEENAGIWIGLARRLGTPEFKWLDGGTKLDPYVAAQNFLAYNTTDHSDSNCVGVHTSSSGNLRWGVYPCRGFRKSLCFMRDESRGFDFRWLGLSLD